MAHIVSVNVDGIAGTDKSLSIDFDRSVNIIFGENGSGKSTILKIIHSAMLNDASILEDCPFDKAEVRIYSINYDKIYTYTIDKKSDKAMQSPENILEIGDSVLSDIRIHPYKYIDSYNNLFASRSAMGWKVKPKNEQNFRGGWSHSYISTSRNIKSHSNRSGMTPAEEESHFDRIFAEMIKNKWTDLSIRIDREIKNLQENGITEIIQALLSPESTSSKRANINKDVEQTYHRFQNFLNRQPIGQTPKRLVTDVVLRDRIKADPMMARVANAISLLEQKIEIANKPRKELEETISNVFFKNKNVVFKTNDLEIYNGKNKRIGLETLSSGEKHMIYILIEAILAGSSSLIIDEPEISMHIAWQKNLVKHISLLNPNAQMIFATHSPEIMADVPDSNIIAL